MSAWDLFIAVKDGNAAETRKLVQTMNVDVHAADWDERQVIHMAAAFGNAEILDFLLEKGASPNAPDKWGITPLHEACQNHHDALALRLLEAGADLSLKNSDGKTPLDVAAAALRSKLIEASVKSVAWDLFHAAREGNLETIRHLVDGGRVDVNVQDWDDRHVLHLVAEYGHLELMRWLLARPGIRVNVQDRWGISPLHEACKHGRSAIAVELVEHGADMFLPDQNDATPLDAANEEMREALVRKLDLRSSALRGDLESVRSIIEKGSGSVDDADSDGNTLLMYAAMGGHERVVKYLLDQGCHRNILNNQGETVMHFAAARDHTACISLLIDAGANFNVCSEDGRTPLLAALRAGSQAAARLLLARGAVFNPQESNFRDLMRDAVKENRSDLFKILEENKVRLYDHVLVELLFLSCRYNAPAVLEMCIRGGVDINVADGGDGRRPAHEAAAHGHDTLLRSVIEDHKANLAARDSAGRSALHVAASNKQSRCALVLMRNGAADDFSQPVFAAATEAAVDDGELLCAANLVDRGAAVTARTVELIEKHVASHGIQVGESGTLRTEDESSRDDTSRVMQRFYGAVLIKAAALGRSAALNILLTNGVDANGADPEGRTALHLAALNGHSEVVRSLLASEAVRDPDARDAAGRTALHLACAAGHAKAVAALVEGGVSVSATDAAGRQAGHHAALHERGDVLRLLAATCGERTHWLAEDDSGLSPYTAALLVAALRDRRSARVARRRRRDEGSIRAGMLFEAGRSRHGAGEAAEAAGRSRHGAGEAAEAAGRLRHGPVEAPASVTAASGAGRGHEGVGKELELVEAVQTIPQVARERSAVATRLVVRNAAPFFVFLVLFTALALYDSNRGGEQPYAFAAAVRRAYGIPEQAGGENSAPQSRYLVGSNGGQLTYGAFLEYLLTDGILGSLFTPTGEGATQWAAPAGRADLPTGPFDRSRFAPLGAVRLRQVIGRADACVVPDPFSAVVQRCYPRHLEDASAARLWGDGLDSFAAAAAEEAAAAAGPALAPAVRAAFEWRDGGPHGGWAAAAGRTDGSTFGPGGFYVDLPPSPDGAAAAVRALAAGRWLDHGTAAVIVEFAVFNPSLRLLASVRALYEFLPTGAVAPRHDVRVSPLRPPDVLTPAGASQVAGELLIAAAAAVVVASRLRLVPFLHGGALATPSAALFDWSMLALLLALIVLRASWYAYAGGLPWGPVPPARYVDYQSLTALQSYQNVLAAFSILMCWLRILLFLTLMPVAGPLLHALAVVFASGPVLTFLLVCLLVAVTYAVGLSIAFSSSVATLHTFQDSLLTVFASMMKENKMIYTGMPSDPNPTTALREKPLLGTLLFASYLLFATMVLVNLFVAIFTESYSGAMAEGEQRWNSRTTRDAFRHYPAVSGRIEQLEKLQRNAFKRTGAFPKAVALLEAAAAQAAAEADEAAAAGEQAGEPPSPSAGGPALAPGLRRRRPAAAAPGPRQPLLPPFAAGYAEPPPPRRPLALRLNPASLFRRVRAYVASRPYRRRAAAVRRRAARLARRAWHAFWALPFLRGRAPPSARLLPSDSETETGSEREKNSDREGEAAVELNPVVTRRLRRRSTVEEGEAGAGAAGEATAAGPAGGPEREAGAQEPQPEVITLDEQIARTERHLAQIKVSLEQRLAEQEQRIAEMKQNLEKLSFAKHMRAKTLHGKLLGTAAAEKKGLGALHVVSGALRDGIVNGAAA